MVTLLKKIKKPRRSFLEILSVDLSLLARMVFIFVIGAGIPMLVSYLFIYANTKNILQDGELKRENGKISLIAANIENRMLVLENITHYMCLDLVLSGFGEPGFSNTSIVSKYENTYDRDVDSVICYHYDNSIADTATVKYVDSNIKAQDWYVHTINKAGEPYWFYEYNESTAKSKLCVARSVTGVEGKRLGLVYAVMDMSEIQSLISANPRDTFLLYDDITVISKNTSQLAIDDLLYAMMHAEKEAEYEDDFSRTIRSRYMRKDAYITYAGVGGNDEKNTFAVVSVIISGEVVSPWLLIFTIFLTFAVGIALSVALISYLSNSYSKRVNKFRQLLHDEAVGKLDDFPMEMTGTDEVGLMARDLYMIIQESQALNRQVMDEKIKQEMLQTKKREVEFRMLSSQINPHFLYNTLETMRMHALVNGDKDVAELAKMLAVLMRHNLKVSNTLEVVATELKLVSYYMKIQDYRFSDRISYEIDADMDLMEKYRMLPLVIQPFVENAYIHGLEGKEEGGRICVRARIVSETEDRLVITVEDNGLGMEEETLAELKSSILDVDSSDNSHIGLKNVISRIRISYGDKYGADIESRRGNGTKVTINLPLIP